MKKIILAVICMLFIFSLAATTECSAKSLHIKNRASAFRVSKKHAHITTHHKKVIKHKKTHKQVKQVKNGDTINKYNMHIKKPAQPVTEPEKKSNAPAPRIKVRPA